MFEANLTRPFLLLSSKRFIDSAKRVFDLGLIVRKPLLKMLRGLGVGFTELDREEVKSRLEKTVSDIMKRLPLIFAPTRLFSITKKRATSTSFTSAADVGDSIVLEFFSEIPRAFKPPLTYYVWLVVPKNAEGGARAKKVFRIIKEKVVCDPVIDVEWNWAEPVRNMFVERGVKGAEENLWQNL
jgi:hypothetical protein